MNPWQLNEDEAATLDALVALGDRKIVGRKLGISDRTVEKRVITIRRKMNAATKYEHLIEWDRWRRQIPHAPRSAFDVGAM